MKRGFELNNRKLFNMFIPLIIFLSAVFLISCASSEACPNLIIITVDTLRADRLGCYGYFRNTSPFIDSFSEECVLFENTITPMATTLPAHISIMTSMNPYSHGVKANTEHLGVTLSTGKGLLTLAQALKEIGYDTAGFVSATSVKSHTGIAAGFDFFNEPEGSERTAENLNNSVLKWLSKRDQKKPLFLWMHYFDPHGPYLPPPPFRTKFSNDSELFKYLKDRGVKELNEFTTGINNLYDGEVSYVDSQLKAFMSKMKESGLYNKSLIILTADHGEGLGQHNWIDHGRIYNEQLYVPLMIKFPDNKKIQHRRIRDLTSLIDILPVIATYFDFPEDFLRQMEGRDILKNNNGNEYIFSERVNRERNWESGLKFSLTGEKWKYFHLTEHDDELYDIQADPHELLNVISENPSTAQAMLERIMPFVEKATSPVGRDETELSPEVIEELRSLGYIN